MSINILNTGTTLSASSNHAKKVAQWRALLNRNRYALDLLGNVLALDPSAVELPDQNRTIKLHYIGNAKGPLSADKDIRRIEKLLNCELSDTYHAENVKVGRIIVNIDIQVPWTIATQEAA